MNKLTAERIIQLLEAPTEDRRPMDRVLRKEAHVKELVTALEMSLEKSEVSDLTKRIICYYLGERHSKRAVPALISALQNPSATVRSSAADALAKIGDPKAGAALYEQFISEESIGAQHMLAAALGAVGYEPAIPVLIQALKHPNEVLRGCAAWSLGALDAKEALEPLQEALALEMDTDSYAEEQMRDALRKITAP